MGIVREEIVRVTIVLGGNYRESNCPGRGGNFPLWQLLGGGGAVIQEAVARGSIIQGGIALEPMFHVATF